jgi:hypothetical protein
MQIAINNNACHSNKGKEPLTPQALTFVVNLPAHEVRVLDHLPHLLVRHGDVAALEEGLQLVRVDEVALLARRICTY